MGMSGEGVDSSFVAQAAERVDGVLVFSTDLKSRYGTVPELGSTADLEIFHNAERGPGGPWAPENVGQVPASGVRGCGPRINLSD